MARILGWIVLLAGTVLLLLGGGRYGFYIGLALVLMGGYMIGKSGKN